MIESVASLSPDQEAVSESSGRRSFRDVRWRWVDVLICFAPYITLRLANLALPPRWLTIPAWLFVPFTFLPLAWLLGYSLWAARRLNGELPRMPRLRGVFVEVRWLPLLIPVLFLSLAVVEWTAISLLGERAIPINGWEPVARSPSRVDRIGLVLLGILCAPLAEEMCFRGLLYNKLRQTLPTVVAIILQAAAFGLMHPFGLAHSFLVALIGVALASVYEWRKTLLAPICLHAAVNAVAMAFMAWSIAADAAGPRLGVTGEPGERGFVLTSVAPDSAAERAGLKPGDVVTTADGFPIPDVQHLVRIVRAKRVGDRVTVEFVRDGKPDRVEAVLTSLPDQGAANK